MGHVTIRHLAMVGMAVTLAIFFGTPLVAHAQITCSQGTTVLNRAVGPQSAPMLVPAQVHVTICSSNGSVVAVIPAFQAVGPAGAPMIVPVNTPVRTCVPTTLVTTPVVGGGLTPVVQLVQVGSGVFAVNLNTVTPSTPVVVTAVPTALTCF